MAKVPQGQKRPADAIGCAVTVAKIATGDFQDAIRSKSGQAGAVELAAALSDDARSAISYKAASVRWGK